MANDSALVSWSAITTNADATPITDLAKYTVRFGQVPGVYTSFIEVGTGTLSLLVTSGNFNNDGKWYFAVSGTDTSGNEGARTLTTPSNKRIIRTGSKIRRVH